MRSSLFVFRPLLLAVFLAAASVGTVFAQLPPRLDFSHIDQEMYEFVGQVNDTEKRHLLSSADILVFVPVTNSFN